MTLGRTTAAINKVGVLAQRTANQVRRFFAAGFPNDVDQPFRIRGWVHQETLCN